MSELFREALRRFEQEERQRPTPAALETLAQAIAVFREDARRAGLDGMTKCEMNTENQAARRERRAKAEKGSDRAGKCVDSFMLYFLPLSRE